MDIIELEREVRELVGLFLEESSQITIITERTPQRGLTADIQNRLENLRVYIKYQRFDLEATRKENETLRELIKASNQ